VSNFLKWLARHPRALEVSLFAFAVLVMGLVMGLAPNSFRPTANYNDYLSFYKPPAVSLLSGHGYSWHHGQPALHDPPGYPLILAFFYGLADIMHVGREGMVNVVTVLTLALACVLVYRLARAMFGLRVGVLAGLLWVTYPIEVLMAPYRFAEVPFTPIMILTALIFVDGANKGIPSWRRVFVVGVLIGFDALIRPQAILLIVPYALALWYLSRQVRAGRDGEAPGGTRNVRAWGLVGLATILGFSYVLTIAPWEAWVKIKTHHVIALSDGGPSAMLNGLTVGLHPKDERGSAHLPASVMAVERRVQADQSHLTTTGKIVTFMGHQFSSHPVAVAELFLLKGASAFYGTNSLTHQALIALVQAPYLILMLIGLILAWRSGGRRRWYAVFLVMVVGYMWVMTIAVLSIVRYMTPALGLMIPFAALALVEGWDAIQRRRHATPPPAPRELDHDEEALAVTP
jgi:Dolichyl-phosphate-mannose-protein mannosyltransferase